jgi:hypothetical protein
VEFICQPGLEALLHRPGSAYDGHIFVAGGLVVSQYCCIIDFAIREETWNFSSSCMKRRMAGP